MGFSEYAHNYSVQAEQLDEDRVVVTKNGPLNGKAGQWEVNHPNGDVELLDDNDFQNAYGTGGNDALDEESHTGNTAPAQPVDPDDDSEDDDDSEETGTVTRDFP